MRRGMKSTRRSIAATSSAGQRIGQLVGRRDTPGQVDPYLRGSLVSMSPSHHRRDAAALRIDRLAQGAPRGRRDEPATTAARSTAGRAHALAHALAAYRRPKAAARTAAPACAAASRARWASTRGRPADGGASAAARARGAAGSSNRRRCSAGRRPLERRRAPATSAPTGRATQRASRPAGLERMPRSVRARSHDGSATAPQKPRGAPLLRGRRGARSPAAETGAGKPALGRAMSASASVAPRPGAENPPDALCRPSADFSRRAPGGGRARGTTPSPSAATPGGVGAQRRFGAPRASRRSHRRRRRSCTPPRPTRARPVPCLRERSARSRGSSALDEAAAPPCSARPPNHETSLRELSCAEGHVPRRARRAAPR